MRYAMLWLKSHRNQQGDWWADSMNHKHEAGSVPEKFMSDAATGYATAALLGARHESAKATASRVKPRN